MKKRILTKIYHQILSGTLYAVVFNDVVQIEEFRFNHYTEGDQNNDSRLDPFKKMILDYLNGCEVDFSTMPLNLGHLSSFGQSVLAAAQSIPRGLTISYEELARKAGFPGAARAAGSVMRNNRFPIIIPCHRVISKSGKIGGYSGRKEGVMIELKKRLLDLEGCNISFI